MFTTTPGIEELKEVDVNGDNFMITVPIVIQETNPFTTTVPMRTRKKRTRKYSTTKTTFSNSNILLS